MKSKELGDRPGEARALRRLGAVHGDLGRFSEGTALDQEHRDDGERHLRDALAHFRAAGSPDAEGVEQLLAASADGTGGQ